MNKLNPLLKGVDSLAHGWQVLGTVLLAGAVTVLSYGLTQAGLADLAGSFLSFYLVFIGTRLVRRIAGGRKSRKHFAESSTLIASLVRDIDAWINDRKILALCILAVPVSIGYLALRSGLVLALGIFSTWYFAAAAGLLTAAIICSPLLFKGIGQLVTTDRGADDDED